MRCDLFKNIKDDLIDETYNYEYVNYLIVKAIFLCNEKKCSLDYLVNYFENIYGATIKSSKLKKYLIDSFEKNGVNNFILAVPELYPLNTADISASDISETRFPFTSEIISPS